MPEERPLESRNINEKHPERSTEHQEDIDFLPGVEDLHMSNSDGLVNSNTLSPKAAREARAFVEFATERAHQNTIKLLGDRAKSSRKSQRAFLTAAAAPALISVYVGLHLLLSILGALSSSPPWWTIIAGPGALFLVCLADLTINPTIRRRLPG